MRRYLGAEAQSVSLLLLSRPPTPPTRAPPSHTHARTEFVPGRARGRGSSGAADPSRKGWSEQEADDREARGSRDLGLLLVRAEVEVACQAAR